MDGLSDGLGELVWQPLRAEAEAEAMLWLMLLVPDGLSVQNSIQTWWPAWSCCFDLGSACGCATIRSSAPCVGQTPSRWWGAAGWGHCKHHRRLALSLSL